jgi:hypothetical protein
VLFLVSVFIFIHNVMYPFLTDRLMLFFLPPLDYGWMSWISLGVFVALMIVIRLLFKCDTKYHILYIGHFGFVFYDVAEFDCWI